MACWRCDEVDATVAVLVVPVGERCHPLTGFLFAPESPAGVVGSVLRPSEQGFGVRIVVRYPWTAEGPEYLTDGHISIRDRHAPAIGAVAVIGSGSGSSTRVNQGSLSHLRPPRLEMQG